MKHLYSFRQFISSGHTEFRMFNNLLAFKKYEINLPKPLM